MLVCGQKDGKSLERRDLLKAWEGARQSQLLL
jgi:hypothetical protein